MLLPLTTVPVPGPGAEDVLVAPDGRVWTGTAEGAIHVHDPRDGSTTTVTATGGRPLGLENLPDGRILVCDAHRGLLALDPASGDLETLLTEVDGDRLLFTNNAAVAPDGTIWFSDSSRIWPIEEWKNDLIEHTCTGRLLRRSPDGEVTTVLDRLCFANGVALTAEMDAVLVAETGTRTIRRVALGADGSPRNAPPGCWPWTATGARCTTWPSTPRTGTWRQGCASTTVGSGSAASSNRRSRGQTRSWTTRDQPSCTSRLTSTQSARAHDGNHVSPSGSASTSVMTSRWAKGRASS